MALVLPVERVDGKRIPDEAGEVRLFSCMRNEADRLRHFLGHYRGLGVDRFFVIDNGSADDTRERLLAEDGVHLFATGGSFAASRCGIAWVRYLLGLYGTGHWCVVVDADELLTYPHAEDVPLARLGEYLESGGFDAMYCVLLDMYSDRAFSETRPEDGLSLQDTCPYYETATVAGAGRRALPLSPTPHLRGGMRTRVFGVNCCLDKVSFFRQRDHLLIREGMHTVQGAAIADVIGAALHFKYLSDFAERARVEAERGEHWRHTAEPKRYLEVMRQNPLLSAYTDRSLRMDSSADLVRTGAIHCPQRFAAFFGVPSEPGEPERWLWADAG